LKKQFIGEVIFRCIRFAHHERLEKIIPQELLPFFPPKPKSFFKYLIQDDLPGMLLRLFCLGVRFDDSD